MTGDGPLTAIVARLSNGDLKGLTDAFPLKSEIEAVWKDGEGADMEGVVNDVLAGGMGVSGIIPLFIMRRARRPGEGESMRSLCSCGPVGMSLVDAGGPKTSASSASHCFILASASCNAVAEGAMILLFAAVVNATGGAAASGGNALADVNPAVTGTVVDENQPE